MINKKILIPKGETENIYNIFVYPNVINKVWEYKNKGSKVDLTKYWKCKDLIKCKK
jgi:hypothetical protein